MTARASSSLQFDDRAAIAFEIEPAGNGVFIIQEITASGNAADGGRLVTGGLVFADDFEGRDDSVDFLGEAHASNLPLPADRGRFDA